MKLTPPKKITFWIAVILGALAVIGLFWSVLTPYAIYLALAGLVLLILALLIKGL